MKESNEEVHEIFLEIELLLEQVNKVNTKYFYFIKNRRAELLYLKVHLFMFYVFDVKDELIPYNSLPLLTKLFYEKKGSEDYENKT